MEKPSIELGPAQVLLFGIGGLIFYYARIEHWIDGAVATIFTRIPGAKLIKKHHPTNAADEIEFLEDCLNGLPELDQFKELGLGIVGKVKEISDVRHAIAHGHLRMWDQPNDILEFSRLRSKKGGGVKRETLTISSTDITASMLLVRDLADAFRHFTQTLVYKFGTDEDRKNVLRGL